MTAQWFAQLASLRSWGSRSFWPATLVRWEESWVLRRVVDVHAARFAVAISPAETTRWASIKLENFPGAMAWLCRSGRALGSTRSPTRGSKHSSSRPHRGSFRRVCGSIGAPAARIVGLPNRVPTERFAAKHNHRRCAALRAFASDGARACSEIEHRFEALQERGFSLAAFLYAGSGGRRIHQTVRVTDDSFPARSSFHDARGESSGSRTAFLIGPARARLGRGPELEINPASIRFASNGASDYEKVRTGDCLHAGGESWIIEASERDLFLTGARGPGGIEVTPPIAPTYDQRAASYGDLVDDPTERSRADGANVWVTRAAGFVPARAFGDDLRLRSHPARRRARSC